MAYTKTTWVNGETPINADNLNHIEGGIKDNETSVGNITGNILWRNSNPTADFAAQTITLSSNDYDMLEVFYRSGSTASGDYMVLSERVIKGYSFQMDFFSNATATRRWSRRIIRVSDTEFNSPDCYEVSEWTLANDQCVPLYIIGYKTGLFGGQS